MAGNWGNTAKNVLKEESLCRSLTSEILERKYKRGKRRRFQFAIVSG